jgi:hypothetical protein
MRLIGFIGVVGFGAGCDGVFGLQEVTTPDARECIRVGHDEDGDTIDDACDPCPFSSANDIDDDNDGIALACDPEPTKPNQRVLFSGFGPDSVTQFDLVNAQISGDAVHVMLTMEAAYVFWGTDVDNVIAMAGVDVQSTTTDANYRQLGWLVNATKSGGDVLGTGCVLVKVQPNSPPVDYVEAYDDLVNDVNFDKQPSPVQIDLFKGTIRADVRRSMAPQLACVWSQTGGASATIAATHPEPQLPAAQLALLLDDITADVKYLFIVTKS